MNIIKQLLKKEGRSQKWLADKVGLSKYSIYKYSFGVGIPQPDKAEQMAKILNTTVKELFPGKFDYCPCCETYSTIKNDD